MHLGNPNGEGIDLNDDKELITLLNGIGLDGAALLSYAQTAPIRNELLNATDDAANRYQVFGVPSMVVHTNGLDSPDDAELYFGNDQILAVRNLLDGGTDPLRSAPPPVIKFIESIPKKSVVIGPKPSTSQAKAKL